MNFFELSGPRLPTLTESQPSWMLPSLPASNSAHQVTVLLIGPRWQPEL